MANYPPIDRSRYSAHKSPTPVRFEVQVERAHGMRFRGLVQYLDTEESKRACVTTVDTRKDTRKAAVDGQKDPHTTSNVRSA